MRNVALSLMVLALVCGGVSAGDAVQPGLVAEYFELAEAPGAKFPEMPADKKPTLVRVDLKVNYANADGEFHATRLSDNFYARWTGSIVIPKAGNYTFFTESDDGSRLSINGKLVVDNGGLHSPEEKSGTVELPAGLHAIKIEYFEGGGGALMKALWQPPGGKKEPIPEGTLVSNVDAEKAISWDKAAWEKRAKAKKKGPYVHNPNARWNKMDYGIALGCTVDLPDDDYAVKGLIVSLDKERKHNICFDTELIRYCASWSGGYLAMQGTPFDGAHGPNPSPLGDVQFTTKHAPGWAKGGEWKDPRQDGDCPLPADWARYKGVYISGDKAVISYTVGSCKVLDMPGVQVAGEDAAFSRTFHIAPTKETHTVLLCEVNGLPNGAGVNTVSFGVDDESVMAGIVGAPKGVEWELDDGRIRLKISPSDEARVFKAVVAKLKDPEKFAQFMTGAPENPEQYTKGGPTRWNEVVTTKGTLAAPEDKGAYVVDTLTVPEENPYNSWMRIGAMDFFADGKRAAVSTWSGDVWIVSGIDDKLEKLEWKRFATGLHQPLGLKIVDDVIYTLGRDQITRLHDLNKNGEADFYENFNNDCAVTRNFHEFAFDLQTDPQGSFYYSKGSPVRPGGRGFDRISRHNGVIMKVSKDGSQSEVFATGLRAPNGIGVGPNGEVTSGDNEGTWVPSCPINWIKKGSFQGVVDAAHRPEKPTSREFPICWLPKKVDNSGGGQVWVTSDKWGPFKNRLLHTAYGTCSLYLVMMQEVDGVMQGGVVKFPLNFISGTMRSRFNPADGQLYIVGLKGWQTTAARDGMFQRVRYTGKPVHMPSELKVTKSGVEITFASPLEPASAADVESYTVERWNVNWTETYGSPEFSVADPKKQGHDPMEVKSAKLTNDNKTVVLALDDLKPVTNMLIKFKVKSADGADVAHEIYHTINKMP